MRKRKKGFMLIEVLIALSLFGLSAVYLVEGAFGIKGNPFMKDTRLEQDLLWARNEIFKEEDYEELSGEETCPR